jgi:Uma2 family endonuclease
MSETRDAAALDFVESDGEPLAETELHLDQVFQLRESLKQLARQRAEGDVHVGSNLLFYFDPKDARKRVAPDVFFVRGLEEPGRLRRTYKLWEERKAPDLIIEVTSRGTWEEDLERKKELYRDVFRTSEYVIFDPEEDLVDGGPLLARR